MGRSNRQLKTLKLFFASALFILQSGRRWVVAGKTAVTGFPALLSPERRSVTQAQLVAIQTLDGVANAIFGIVAFLVIKDRTHQGTGRFNLAAGALVTTMGIGSAVSNAVGGALVQRAGYDGSFLSLAAIALAAFVLLQVAIPETLPQKLPAG